MSANTRTGWVYVLTNAEQPGLVKIGVSSRRPEERARELYTTGVPVPFEVATAFLFADNAGFIEQETHRRLANVRVRSGSEHFRCSAHKAAEAILWASEKIGSKPVNIKPKLLTQKEVDEIKRKKEERENAILQEQEEARRERERLSREYKKDEEERKKRALVQQQIRDGLQEEARKEAEIAHRKRRQEEKFEDRRTNRLVTGFVLLGFSLIVGLMFFLPMFLSWQFSISTSIAGSLFILLGVLGIYFVFSEPRKL